MAKAFSLDQMVNAFASSKFPIDRKQALAMPVEQLVRLSVRLHEDLVALKIRYDVLAQTKNKNPAHVTKEELTSCKLQIEELRQQVQTLQDENDVLQTKT